jgi:hypothetical protein
MADQNTTEQQAAGRLLCDAVQKLVQDFMAGLATFQNLHSNDTDEHSEGWLDSRITMLQDDLPALVSAYNSALRVFYPGQPPLASPTQEGLKDV